MAAKTIKYNKNSDLNVSKLIRKYIVGIFDIINGCGWDHRGDTINADGSEIPDSILRLKLIIFLLRKKQLKLFGFLTKKNPILFCSIKKSV